MQFKLSWSVNLNHVPLSGSSVYEVIQRNVLNHCKKFIWYEVKESIKCIYEQTFVGGLKLEQEI